jgi:dipeptidyl aminopeptidase/acylaminoacyl peptidase
MAMDRVKNNSWIGFIFFAAAMICYAPAGMAQSAASGALKPLTAQQAINTHGIGDLHFSPDGLRVAMTVSEPVKGATRLNHIWMLNVTTKELRQFTASAKSEDSPRWSPDGKKLAFLSDREESRQIYTLTMDGGEALPLTKGKNGVQSFAWSPDGKQIAYLAQEPKTDDEEKKEKDKDDARVADKDEHHARVWLLDVESGKSRQVTSGKWQISEIEWMPDGSRLIAAATNTPESDEYTSRVYAIAVADGKMTELAAPKGPFGRMRVSPDGKSIAFVGSRVDGPSPHDLFVMSSEGGTPKNLSDKALDRPIGAYEWRPDGSLFAEVQSGFKTNFVTIGADGAVKTWPGSSLNPRAFDIDRSGKVISAGASATRAEELYEWKLDSSAANAGGASREALDYVPLSHFNDSWKEYALAKPEFVKYKSFDGMEIEGAVLKPANYQAGTKYPMVVLVHGGPTGAWSDSIETWGQLLAAHGFLIFYPNVRGSTGYGHKFIEANRNDWGGADFKDVMAGVDYMIAQGAADPNRMGIGGWSYGGYMSEWAITQTTRFKAAVSGAGLANLASEFGTENGSAYDEWFFGTPYENLDAFMKSSPVKYLKNAKTPTLILQGDADTTDPIGQSEELYRGLKHYGVEAEMVVYPREPHGLREEKHLMDRLNRIVAWYEGHLMPTTKQAAAAQ